MCKQFNEMSKPAKKNIVPNSKNIAPQKQYVIFLPIILIITFFIFSSCLKNQILHFDDYEYFTDYPEVLKISVQNISTFFKNYYVIMYQPLPVISYALNYKFSALNPYPIHLINVLFHLLNIVLVYKFILMLLKNNFTALFVAFLFAIHPLNAEVVAWMSARSSSMYTCFYLFAIISYLKYLESNFAIKYFIISMLFFLFSLVSKTQAVTLPIVLVLLDYFYGRKLFSARIIIEKTPFFLLSIFFGIVTLLNKATLNNITDGMMVSYNAVQIFFMVCYSFAFYLCKLFVPTNLCSIYVYPELTNNNLPSEYYLSPVILLLFLYFIYRNRQNKIIVFGALLFAATIIINIQIIPSRLFIVADRYAYFPYIGLFIILSEIVIVFIKKYTSQKWILYTAATIYFICFAYTDVARCAVWKNEETLMTNIIANNKDVPYMCRVYGTRSNYFIGKEKFDEALSDINKAIECKNNDVFSLMNRATLYMNKKEYLLALVDLKSAQKYTSNSKQIYILKTKAEIHTNNFLEAKIDCEKYIQLDSTNAVVYNMHSIILSKENKLELCMKDLNKAIALKPDFADAYNNRAKIFYKQNNLVSACKDWQIALQLGSKNATEFVGRFCK